jgi:flagellar biosynthesis/type III secretory pathway protein FliH
MSTSPKLSPLRDSPARGAARQPATASTYDSFPYDVVPLEGVLRRPTEGKPALGYTATGDENPETDDPAAREAQARAQGQSEGQATAYKAFQEQLARERAGVAATLAGFARERAAYFEKVEAEVVQLALAIARKILHREAQVDPLLLAGIVRVALDQIEGATGVRLRVHPQKTEEWRRFFAAQLDPANIPEIIGDPAQPPDRCTLETSMGTAVLGLEVQLKEIEQGLMDLLAARPRGGMGVSP